jgi:nucleoside-diphosphate-sugar epimerase
VRELIEHGWSVVNLDTRPPTEPSCPFIRVDLTDYGQTVEALTLVDDRHRGLDAVVHLAAVPAPGLTTNAATFHNNVPATYNVFAAARAAGIKDVVWASSETVLGLPFETPPPYLPADEEYPPSPESTYSLGKVLEEQMAAQFCRWDPDLKMIGLRFSNVMEIEDYAAFPGFEADLNLRRWNLWSYIDARDGAQAVRRALDYSGRGMEIFVIANADTVMSRPTKELIAEVYPNLPLRREISGNDSLFSIDKARRLLGFEPQHSWRGHAPSGGH